MLIPSLIGIKMSVSWCVVKLARKLNWNMAYVVPIMAALWVPLIYLIASECVT